MPVSSSPAATRSAPAVQHGRGFWIVAFAFLTSMAFASAPAPLYVLYQQRSGFSSFTVTLIFAAYALGVVLLLFLAGHLSARAGRRRSLVPAVALVFISTLVFIFWQALPGLLPARFVSGLGVGMLTATATACMTELHATSRPGTGLRRAEVIATAANIGGLGLGPLVSGMLAEFAPAPLYTTYLVFAALLLLGLLSLARVPETVQVDRNWNYRPQRVSVPPEAHSRFAAAAMMAFVGFAMFGLFTSLAPALIAGELAITSHVVSGAVAFVVFAAAAAMQVVSSRWSLHRQTTAGLACRGIGLLLVTASILVASLALLVIGGLVAGAGSGMSFKAGIGTAISIASPAQRGEALAGIFLAGYLGMSVPVLLLGALMQFIALAPSVLGFGVFMLLLLGVTLLLLMRSRRAGI